MWRHPSAFPSVTKKHWTPSIPRSVECTFQILLTIVIWNKDTNLWQSFDINNEALYLISVAKRDRKDASTILWVD